jgi:hypothetical protein
MKVSSFVSILTTSTEWAVEATGNFHGRPSVEDLQRSETVPHAIPV